MDSVSTSPGPDQAQQVVTGYFSYRRGWRKGLKAGLLWGVALAFPTAAMLGYAIAKLI